jgi:hypothetical protein
MKQYLPSSVLLYSFFNKNVRDKICELHHIKFVKPAKWSKETQSMTTPISPQKKFPFTEDASATVELRRTKFSEKTL